MQINSVNSARIVQNQQNFKGSSVNSNPLSSSPSYQPMPLEASKAYASPQITQGYKEIETFDVPYIGKGKLYELSNGHKIIMVPKASKTFISTIVGAGSSDEAADKKNMAHLTEHLLANYWHSASPTSSISNALKETGAYTNASTGNCNTKYYISANVQDNTDLENLMEIQLGTLTNNNFSDDEIQKEKNIIIEEAKENRYFVDKERIARYQSLKNLFNLDDKNGAVAKKTIQKIEDIKKEDLDKFYSNFYRPDNMTTVIVGNVDNKSIEIISKYLNKMRNPKPQIERNNLSGLKDGNQIKQFKRTDIEGEDKSNKFWHFIDLSFVGPKVNNPKDTDNILLLNKILENRLKQQNIDIDAGIPTVSEGKNVPQIVEITGKARIDDVENNIKIIYSTVGDLAKNSASKEELDKAKEQILEELSGYLEDNELFASFLNDALLSDPKIDVKSSFDHLKNISADDIQSVAKKYLDLNKASLVVVHANEIDTAKTNEVSFKGLAELSNTNDIKEYDLPNNLHVIFDTRPGIVKTAISCKFFYEDKQKNNNGIIDAMQSSMIRDENDEFPAGNWIDKEGITIRKSGSSDKIQDIIKDVKKELIDPEFNNRGLDEAKKRQKEHTQKAESIYPRDLLETSDVPQKENEICPDWVKNNDLKVYYNNLLSNSQGTIIITIPKEKFEQVESDIINSLSELPTIKPHDFSKILNQDDPKNLEKNSIFLDKDDTSDKVKIKKEFKMIDNGNIKDEAGIILLNSILNSSLDKSLREDLGLTYGAYSAVEKYNPKSGIMTIGTEIAKTPLNDNTKIALTQIDNIINQLATTKIDEAILNNTKKQIKSNLLIPAETSVDRNLNLENEFEKSYDINHPNKLAETLDSITSDDLQKIAQKYLTKPYLLEIEGNNKAIEANKDYLSALGEIKNY